MKRMLKTLCHEYTHLYPKEAADYLDALPEPTSFEIIAELDGTDIAKLITHSSVTKAMLWINQLPETTLIKVFQALGNDLCPLILRRMNKTVRSRIIDHLPETKKKYLKKNMDYPTQTIGSFTDPVVLSIHEEKSVGDALALIQNALDFQHDCLYVVDHNQRLVGIMTLREFIRSSTDKKITTVMQKPSLVLQASSYQAKHAEKISLHEREEIPVIDSQRRLIGIIRKSLINQFSDDANPGIQEPPMGVLMSFAELFWTITGNMLPLPGSSETKNATRSVKNA